MLAGRVGRVGGAGHEQGTVRVLPERLRRRLDAVPGSLAFTDPPRRAAAAREPAVLLPMADAVHHHRPVSVRYTAGDGRSSERILHPYGVVAHSGRWYATAADPSAGGTGPSDWIASPV